MAIRAALAASSLLASVTLPPAAAGVAVQTDPALATDGIRPLNYTVLGGAEAVARQSVLRYNIARAEARQCARIGCLVIVNQTRGYEVAGLYLETGKQNGASLWTRNQFVVPLGPMSAFHTLKAGDDAMCEQPVRFELVHRTTGERIEARAIAALCRRHGASTLLRIRVQEPDVRVLIPNVTVVAPD